MKILKVQRLLSFIMKIVTYQEGTGTLYHQLLLNSINGTNGIIAITKHLFICHKHIRITSHLTKRKTKSPQQKL